MMHILSIPWLAGGLLALMPAGLILMGLPGVRRTRQSALTTRNRVRWTAIFTLLLALTADLVFVLGARSSLLLASVPLPALHFALPLSIAVDPLTLILASVVSFVLVMIAQYSVAYLDGDPQQARFFRLLAFTGGFFLLTVISGNIGLFTLAIIAVGFSVNRLLRFYGDRPKAIMAAHKKSLFTRTADLCLVAATLLIGHSVGSLQFVAIRSFVEQAGTIPMSLQVAAWLIVAAVFLKSAHFPAHGWLIQVMEAPTPVSALMHAGIVYSGAIVALRTSALLIRVPDALLILGLAGLTTVMIASLVMTTQTSIKSMLAWSTTAQLGFMSLELGLGLFPLALLHLVGHSLYKAHAFLSSGSITDQLRQVPPGAKKKAGLVTWLTATVLGVLISAGAAWCFGENPFVEPVWFALVLIVAAAISQILIKGFLFDAAVDRFMAILVAVAMGLIYLVLHTLFVWGFSADLTRAMPVVSGAYMVLVGLTAVGFLFLSFMQGPGHMVLPKKVQWALFTYLYNGLYTDYWVEQFSHRFWSERVSVKLPRKNLAVESLQSVARNQESMTMKEVTSE